MRFAQLSHQGIVSAIRDTAAGDPGMDEDWIWSLAESPDHGVHFRLIALADMAADPRIGDRYDDATGKFVPHAPWLRERLARLDGELEYFREADRRQRRKEKIWRAANPDAEPDEIAEMAAATDAASGAAAQASAVRDAHVARMKASGISP